jgi:ribosomal protein S12 methylthiotransferase
MASFDVVSKVDFHEIDNALNQAVKEIAQRYDFKDTKTTIELKEGVFHLESADEYRLASALEVLEGKLAKRKVPLGALDRGKVEPASGARARQEIKIRSGLETETARAIVKTLKDRKLKVQAAIQGDVVRVTGKKRDELQEVIGILREGKIRAAPPVRKLPRLSASMDRKKIFFKPLGCAKNQVDGELMLGGARAAGHELVSNPEDADVLVVNTCAFIDAAREESVDAILDLARYKSSGRRLVVTGCLAERYGDELTREIPEIDAMIGTGALDRFNEALAADGGAIFKGAKHYLPAAAMERVVTEGDGSAYVKVSEGCDHECAFCVIPQIRGRHESRPLDDVVSEVEGLAARGVLEFNLIAQDLSAYGRDLGVKEGLAELLYRLGRVRGVRASALLLSVPEHADRRGHRRDGARGSRLQVRGHPLAARRRRGAEAHAPRARCRRATPYRRARAHAARRSGVAHGVHHRISGETDRAFDALLSFVEEVRFDHVAVFRYSHEEGSGAADLDGRVPRHVAEFRRDRLLAAQEPISEERGPGGSGSACAFSCAVATRTARGSAAPTGRRPKSTESRTWPAIGPIWWAAVHKSRLRGPMPTTSMPNVPPDN